MNYTPIFESVWDALIDDPDTVDDLKECSHYLILIQARLNGQSGSESDKARGSNYRLIKCAI